MTAKAKPLGGQTSAAAVFGENNSAVWTMTKKIAAVVKNSMANSATSLTLRIEYIVSLSTPAFAITELCDWRQKVDALLPKSLNIWRRCGQNVPEQNLAFSSYPT
jgi:hypothetical protein